MLRLRLLCILFGVVLLTACGAEEAFTAEVRTVVRACAETTCQVIHTLQVGERIPIIRREVKEDDRYWLVMKAETGEGYIGPFIQYSRSAYTLIREARSCPDLDCPVLFELPLDQPIELLLLPGSLTDDPFNIWMHFALGEQTFYLGQFSPLGASASYPYAIAGTATASASDMQNCRSGCRRE